MRGHFSWRGPGSRQPTRSGGGRCRWAMPAGNVQEKHAGSCTAMFPRPHSLGSPGIRAAQLVTGRVPEMTTKQRDHRNASTHHGAAQQWHGRTDELPPGQREAVLGLNPLPSSPKAMARAVMEQASPQPRECWGLRQAGMERGHRAAPHPLPISRDKQKGLSVTTFPGSKSLWGQSSEVKGKAAARHMARSCPTRAEPSTLPVSEPWSQPPVHSFSEDDTASLCIRHLGTFLAPVPVA